MSHSEIPPQGPNPFPGRGSSPEPERRDFGARQAMLIIGAIVVSIIFITVVVSLTRNAQSDDPDGFDSSCESTGDEGYPDSTDDGYGLDETDDYGFGEETTEDCW